MHWPEPVSRRVLCSIGFFSIVGSCHSSEVENTTMFFTQDLGNSGDEHLTHHFLHSGSV